MSTVAASVRWAALVALLGGCEGARGCRAARPTGAAATPPVAAPASGDGGTRIMRTLAEIPPLGPSADGREVDVPIAWAYLLSEPSPTGSAPYAVVGATLPCGFAPAWTISTRAPATGPEGGGTVRLRMRARWQGPGEPSPAARTCASPPTAVQLVSLSVLRLGAWPRLEGHDLRLHRQRAWDLEQTRRVWVRGTDPAAAGLLVGGVYAAVLVLGWIAIFRELPGISGP